MYTSLQYRLPRWLSGEEPTCQRRGPGFRPWVGKIPGRRNILALRTPWTEEPSRATVHRVRDDLATKQHIHIVEQPPPSSPEPDHLPKLNLYVHKHQLPTPPVKTDLFLKQFNRITSREETRARRGKKPPPKPIKQLMH